MSYARKQLVLFVLVTCCVASHAVAEISPTGRPTKQTASKSRTTSKAIPTTTKASLANSRATRSPGLGAFNVGVTQINYANSNVALGAIEDIEMQPGTTYNLFVPIQRNGYTGNLYFASVFSTFQETLAANGKLIALVHDGVGSYASGYVHVQVTAEFDAIPGTQIDFRLMGNEEPNHKTIATQNFTVTIAESQNSYAQIDMSSMQDAVPYYGTGWGFADTIFAMYDSNANGVVDSATGNNNAAFPAQPSLFGPVEGRGYANPHGERANLIVAGTFDDGQLFSIHLKVADDGDVYPIMAMVGDLAAGELLVQDLDGWQFEFEGSFPQNGQSGNIEGSMTFTPFFYDGIANAILGNTVTINFDVELVPDA